ncbi:MAG: hypothetical protein H2057_03355 [Alphaproteobacteria bacterium]|nr:hypothetical protein [Alphaproteobacteria bacterium]
MKSGRVFYFVSVFLSASLTQHLWSSQGVSCIRCNGDPVKYCGKRYAATEATECLTNCSTSKSPVAGPAIEKCFAAMDKVKNWSVADKITFEGWYHGLGEGGRNQFSHGNLLKLEAFIQALEVNSDKPEEPRSLQEPVLIPPKPLSVISPSPPSSSVGNDLGDQSKTALSRGSEPKSSEPPSEIPPMEGGTSSQSSQPSSNPPLVGHEVPIEPLFYLAMNPDLVEAFGHSLLKNALVDLRNHYRNHATQENRLSHPDTSHRPPHFHTKAASPSLPRDFNPIEYLALHNDLVLHYENQGLTLSEALDTATTHYLSSGVGEGRNYTVIPSSERSQRSQAINDPSSQQTPFNVLLYLSMNPDIAVHFGGLPYHAALNAAEEHYRQKAQEENRLAAPDSKHSVPELLPTELSEKVRGALPNGFNALLYIEKYPDIAEYFSRGGQATLKQVLTEATIHYVEHGVEEKRFHGGEDYKTTSMRSPQPAQSSSEVVEKEVDPLLYLALHPDLVNTYGGETFSIAVEHAHQHYLTRGQEEKRMTTPDMERRAPPLRVEGMPSGLPDGFNPLVYIFVNDDLRKYYLSSGMTLSQVLVEAARHYLINGINENRVIHHPNQQGGVGSSGDSSQVPPPPPILPVTPPRAYSSAQSSAGFLGELTEGRNRLQSVQNPRAGGASGSSPSRTSNAGNLLEILQGSKFWENAQNHGNESDDDDDDSWSGDDD